jgi:hypothetical protein
LSAEPTGYTKVSSSEIVSVTGGAAVAAAVTTRAVAARSKTIRSGVIMSVPPIDA